MKHGAAIYKRVMRHIIPVTPAAETQVRLAYARSNSFICL